MIFFSVSIDTRPIESDSDFLQPDWKLLEVVLLPLVYQSVGY